MNSTDTAPPCLYDVPFEPQTMSFSCAAKAVQLVMHHHAPDLVPLGPDVEHRLLGRARLGRFPNATHAGTILAALEDGFNVNHLCVHPAVFTYPDRPVHGHVMPRAEFDEKVAIDCRYFARADRLGRRLVVVPVVEPDILRRTLQGSGPLIAMTDLSGDLHDVVIRGYDGDTFYAVDPILGHVAYGAAQLARLVNTRYGVSVFGLQRRPL